jgi:hypothetical protein
MSKHEQKLIEDFLRQALGANEDADSCARTALCSLGLNEPIQFALTDARLALKEIRYAVGRADAAVNMLLAIRDREEG